MKLKAEQPGHYGVYLEILDSVEGVVSEYRQLINRIQRADQEMQPGLKVLESSLGSDARAMEPCLSENLSARFEELSGYSGAMDRLVRGARKALLVAQKHSHKELNRTAKQRKQIEQAIAATQGEGNQQLRVRLPLIVSKQNFWKSVGIWLEELDRALENSVRNLQIFLDLAAAKSRILLDATITSELPLQSMESVRPGLIYVAERRLDIAQFVEEPDQLFDRVLASGPGRRAGREDVAEGNCQQADRNPPAEAMRSGVVTDPFRCKSGEELKGLMEQDRVANVA